MVIEGGGGNAWECGYKHEELQKLLDIGKSD